MPWIELTEPGEPVQRRDVGDGLTIGRGLDCDAVLKDPSVSGRHAWVRPTPEGVVLIDLHSTNGCTVNGVEISEEILQPNQTFTLGDVQGVFHDPDAEVPPAPKVLEPGPPPTPSSDPDTIVVRTCSVCGYIKPGGVKDCPRCRLGKGSLQADEEPATSPGIRFLATFFFAAGLAGPLLLGVGWLIGILGGIYLLVGSQETCSARDAQLARRAMLFGMLWVWGFTAFCFWWL